MATPSANSAFGIEVNPLQAAKATGVFNVHTKLNRATIAAFAGIDIGEEDAEVRMELLRLDQTDGSVTVESYVDVEDPVAGTDGSEFVGRLTAPATHPDGAGSFFYLIRASIRDLNQRPAASWLREGGKTPFDEDDFGSVSQGVIISGFTAS